MATVWDRIFKDGMDPGDSGISTHAVTAALYSYAVADIPSQTVFGNSAVDHAGVAWTAAEKLAFKKVLDDIDLEATTDDKLRLAERYAAAIDLVEADWFTAAQAKGVLGI